MACADEIEATIPDLLYEIVETPLAASAKIVACCILARAASTSSFFMPGTVKEIDKLIHEMYNCSLLGKTR